MMRYEIVPLPKEKWKGTVIPMRYTTDAYFDLELTENAPGENAVRIRRAGGQKLSEGSALFWTLDRSGELIGELYAFLDLEDRDFADGEGTAYLCAFRVKREYRGRGLGSRLLAAALAELKALGFHRATIGVGCDEPQNLRLYRRFGFTEKIKDCHYDPCGRDEQMRPLYEDTAWALLQKDLTETDNRQEAHEIHAI